MLHSSSPSSSTTSVGCMSGIFSRLFSNHHSNRRNFLTFGKKAEEIRSSESPRSPTLPDVIPQKSSSEAAEKRMLLLGALAKCDQDLRELKKIIEELKSDSLAVEREDELTVRDDILITELSSGEQPSPVSVLDELTPCAGTGRRSLQLYGNVQQQQQKKKRREEEFHFLGYLHLKKIQRVAHHGNNLSSSPLWCSRAMVETVEKACSEIAWGEKRERGRIGMALHDQIYRDLMEETVKEVIEIGKMQCAHRLKLSYSNGKLLQSRGCRRRLSY